MSMSSAPNNGASHERDVPQLDPSGFNELRMCRWGPMVYNRHDMFVGASLQKYGELSQTEQDLFAQIVQPGAVVVEVGANIGAHTIALSRAAGVQGRIYAFEPQRIVFQTLCANLALNHCTNVYARQVAVGAEVSTIVVPDLDPGSRANFGGLSLRREGPGDVVPLVMLDGLYLAACHFLKIDVEGMEIEVLNGAEDTIRNLRPIMYVENDRKERSEELLTTIQRLGYRAYWQLAPLFNPANFAGDAEDIFPGIVSINVLCVAQESPLQVQGLPLITSTREWWR